MTKIQWTDETWNIVVGCSRVPGSPGCMRCYAATAATSARLQQFPQYQAVKNWDGTVQFVESQLTKPLHWRKPKRIFVCSMADLFHANVPNEWIDRVMAVIALSPQHTFQVLTKRPERALEYLRRAKQNIRRAVVDLGRSLELKPESYEAYETCDFDWPLKNCWLGVSTENQAMADKRIPILLQIPAAVRFLSCEPLLGEIDFKLSNHSLSWCIVGGESGANSRPCHIEWIESIVHQCKSANVPVFVKQLGANAYLDDQRFRTGDRKGGNIEEFPERLRVREFPKPVVS